EEVDELVTRRVAEEMEDHEAARTLEPLNETRTNKKVRMEEIGIEVTEEMGMEKTKMEIEMGIMDNALTWWSSHKRTIGVEAAYAIN
ncbi:hypothetical protein Tco_0337842, partial [Tanacetum coccineum]